MGNWDQGTHLSHFQTQEKYSQTIFKMANLKKDNNHLDILIIIGLYNTLI